MAEVRRGLDEDGYCVLPGIVSRDTLTTFNQRVLDAYRRAPKFKGGGSISGHLNCFPGEAGRSIYEQIEEHGILEVIQAVCPQLPHVVRATLNFNLPGSVKQHYHMDGVYLEDYVICNVAVVDTDIKNGAIDLLPSTNQRFYPYWKYALTRRYRLSTRIPMEQGDVLLRRSTLWHRGMPNLSSEPRPMFSLAVGERYVDTSDPFDRDGGEMEFYANWYRTGRIGALRERLEVSLPFTRSAARFVRSLHGNRGYSSY
jgi:ectoine hydroxylase-related dioxygenase (phytanoyl-CoA dioxygenase family)